ncbi:MAG TPA: hypothetical protein VF698_04990 [Thermoanaerobaculia bacterium]|jgi:hypothetical protein
MKDKPELEQWARDLVLKGLDSLAGRAESSPAQQLAGYWTGLSEEERTNVAAKIVEAAESVLAAVPFAALTNALPKRRGAKAAPRRRKSAASRSGKDEKPKKDKNGKNGKKEKKKDKDKGKDKKSKKK